MNKNKHQAQHVSQQRGKHRHISKNTVTVSRLRTGLREKTTGALANVGRAAAMMRVLAEAKAAEHEKGGAK